MSLYSSLFANVTGLNANATAISIMSDNILNIDTIGYKAGQVDFSTLLTSASSRATSASNDLSSKDTTILDQKDLSKDIHESNEQAPSSNDNSFIEEDTLYTRAGSFRKDAKGNYINVDGIQLMGWPLDDKGNKLEELGNINATPHALLASLEPVNAKSVLTEEEINNPKYCSGLLRELKIDENGLMVEHFKHDCISAIFQLPEYSAVTTNIASDLEINDASSSDILGESTTQPVFIEN
jgi:flagellar basal body rod protein FlgB